MTQELKEKLNFTCGNRALSSVFARCSVPQPADAPGYVCVKPNFLKAGPTNPFRGTLLVGPQTSRFLVCIGLHKTAAWLNSCRPSWLEFTVDKFGVQISTMPNSDMLEWFGIIACGLSKYHHMAWERPTFHDPFDLRAHNELVRSYGSQCRKAVLDVAYEQRAIIWIKATGEVMVNENISPWLTCCVGWVLKYRACPDHISVLRNWVQPRWVVFADDSTWVCRINHALLAQNGDVESNPGPIIRAFARVLLVCLVCHFGLLGSVALVNTVSTSSLYKWFVQPRIIAEWDRCSMQDSYSTFWTGAIKDRPLWTYFVLWPVPAALETSIWCDLIVFRFGRHGPEYHGPLIARIDLISSTAKFVDFFKIFQFAAIWMGVFVITTPCLVLFVCLVYASRHSSVRVINKNGAIDINAMRRKVESQLKTVIKPEKTVGHQWLARQRRQAEAVVIDYMLENTNRFRDVGGSRTRFSELGAQKHICCPKNLFNDDALRELKSPEIFPNCEKRGQDCPQKYEIPWAMLSHVDYHLTQSELVRTIVGPTFVINHDFAARPTKLGNLNNRAEAELSYFGNRVTMTTDDGTKYQHVFHEWGNEGSVVTQQGAFVYCLLTRFHDTCIYFCYPAEGDYNRTDVNVMPPDGDDALPMINGYNVLKELDLGVYKFDKRSHSFEVKANLIEECAISFGACNRDDKYPTSLLSYVTARCKAMSVDTSNLDCIVRLVAYLADVKAVSTVYSATCIKGHPVDFRWYDLCRLKTILWLRHRSSLAFCLFVSKLFSNDKIKRATAWTFPKVIVPTYEIYTQRVRSKYLVTGVKQFASDRFQSPPTPAHACSDEHPKCCTGEDSSECDHIPRDKSVKHGPKAVPTNNQQCRGGTGISLHDGSTKPPTSTRPESCAPKVGEHAVQVANCKEKSDSNKSCGPTGGESGVNVPSGATSDVQLSDCGPDLSADAQYLRGSVWEDEGDRLVLATSYSDAKDTRVVLAEDVSAGLMGLTNQDSEHCLGWIDAICTRVSRFGDSHKCAELSKGLCRIASGCQSVGKGRSFDFPRCVVRVGRFDGDHDRVPGTCSFQDLDVTISRKTEGDAGGGLRSCNEVRVVEERSDHEKFSKNRNKSQRKRPTKHQPAERRDARDARSVH